MYKFYRSVENEGRTYSFMDSQPEINDKMRAILIDWLVQVHHKFELSPETLYLTINIIDRYLESRATSRRELQLAGMSAMLIASKYEKFAPEVNELVCISDRTYTNEQVLIMEKRILGELEWNLTVPTAYVFLVRFIKASMTDSDVILLCESLKLEPEARARLELFFSLNESCQADLSSSSIRITALLFKVENMVYFLGMMNYEILIYSPSKLAASAVYAARCTLNRKPTWNQTLEMHTGFSEQEITKCANGWLVFILWRRVRRN
ncbi:G2/mitotic-specific cyclin-1 [Orobanche gracilis]